MSATAEEIATQPSCWRQAASRAGELAGVLPGAGSRVVAVGCGTSFHIAQAFAAARESSGQGETDAFTASEMPVGRAYDCVLALSRSGTTTEVLRLLDALPRAVPTVAVTTAADLPVARRADRVVTLDFADERSVVQTRFATSALALLLAPLGHDVGASAAAAEQALASPLPCQAGEHRQHVFLGRGWCVGLAGEAALKVREAAAAWSEAYPAMEYRHGPISVADPGTLVWTVGPAPADLIADVAATGATVVDRDLDPLAELVAAQRFAVALAQVRGLDPDRPRHLSRSVTLP